MDKEPKQFRNKDAGANFLQEQECPELLGQRGNDYFSHQTPTVVKEQNLNQWESIDYPTTVGITSFQSQSCLQKQKHSR